MSIIDRLHERIIERSKGFPVDNFLIHGQWAIDLLFQPNQGERIFNYQILVAQTQNQGACYAGADQDIKLEKSFIGKDARLVTSQNKIVEIAFLDAAYSSLNANAEKEFSLDGSGGEKAIQRAIIVSSEVLYRLPETRKQEMPSVVNVGAVGTILEMLIKKGCKVFATDLDTDLIGQYCGGVAIQDGNKYTLELIEKCDVALVTGMTLATSTLDEILYVAKKSKTTVVIFAETGAWFASEYCMTFGVASVISEPFPFYIYAGRSLIRLHREPK